MTDYEIRYLKQDGSLGMLYAISCTSDNEAQAVATGMFSDRFASYEIWQDMRLVEKDSRQDTNDERRVA